MQDYAIPEYVKNTELIQNRVNVATTDDGVS